jgi:hypothetical protein
LTIDVDLLTSDMAQPSAGLNPAAELMNVH